MVLVVPHSALDMAAVCDCFFPDYAHLPLLVLIFALP